MFTTTTSATVITAQDFSSSTTDPDRDRWTEGKMRYVIAALDGAPVAITVEERTGHTAIGVRLVGLVPGGGGDHARVRVEYRHSDGTVQVLNHLLFLLGPVITPLVETGRGAKWAALDMQREEQSAAIAYARERHGECEGRAWGRWSASGNARDVSVTYTPLTSNPFYKDQWGQRWYGSVTLEQVAEQQAVFAARQAELREMMVAANAEFEAAQA